MTGQLKREHINSKPQNPTIMFVDHTGSPGGGQLGLKRFTHARHEDFDIEVAFLQGGEVAESIAEIGVPTTVLSQDTKRSLIRDVTRLTRLILRRRPRLIVANSLRAALVLTLLPLRKRSCGAYLREDLSVTSIGPRKAFIIGRLILPRFGLLIVNSESTRLSLPGDSRHRTRARLAYPVSGVKSRMLTEEIRRHISMKRDEHPFRVLSLSRLQWWKGIDLLIEAAIILRDTHGLALQLTIAGGGGLSDSDYERKLRASAIPLGDSVSFIGHVEDVDSLLRKHHVLCVCSRTPEAFGQVVPQALAQGVPVIAPNAGGPREILSLGLGGRVIDPGSAESLAKALHEFAIARSDWEQLALQAPVIALRYSDPETTRELANILHDYMQNHSPDESR